MSDNAEKQLKSTSSPRAAGTPPCYTKARRQGNNTTEPDKPHSGQREGKAERVEFL